MRKTKKILFLATVCTAVLFAMCTKYDDTTNTNAQDDVAVAKTYLPCDVCDGEFYPITCPQGLYFNPVTLHCDWPANIEGNLSNCFLQCLKCERVCGYLSQDGEDMMIKTMNSFPYSTKYLTFSDLVHASFRNNGGSHWLELATGTTTNILFDGQEFSDSRYMTLNAWTGSTYFHTTPGKLVNVHFQAMTTGGYVTFF